MADMIKIAVVVPVYNCEKHLSDCLDSIISQTYTNWEAYCVDDGSNDSSGNILDEYARQDCRIIALHKSNGGEHSARNYAFDRISAEPDKWIAFVDGDDYISPFMFERLAHILESITNLDCQYMRLYSQRTPFDIRNNACYQLQLSTSRGNYKFTEEDMACRLLTNEEYFADGRCGGQISSAFIHSELIDKYHFRGPEEMKVLGDQVFTMRCAMKSKIIAECKIKDYYYRYNPTSVINTTRDTSEYIIRCLNYVYTAFYEDGITPARFDYLEKVYIPNKIEALLNTRFHCGKRDTQLPHLSHGIMIRKYLKSFKAKALYLVLKCRRLL